MAYWTRPRDSLFLDCPGEFLAPVPSSHQIVCWECGREWSLVFGLERRVTSLLKRGGSGTEMDCLTSYLLLGKSIALGLSCSVGESAVMMPISTAEMG